MYIVASFEYGNHLELAISDIERIGVPKDKILAIPLDKRVEKARVFDSIHRSDGVSILDIPAILGTVFMLLGVIYGFRLAWGPIIWGIIGLTIGVALGLLLKYINRKKQVHEHSAKLKEQTEVFLMIHCRDDLKERIMDILWEHNAYGIGGLKKG
jgi:hypothetical protein